MPVNDMTLYPFLMRGLAEELGIVSAFAHNVESAMAGLAERTAQGEVIENLQNMDLLIQHVSELRAFVLRLQDAEKMTEPGDAKDALEAIKLQSLKWRLSNALGLALDQDARAESGCLEYL